MNSQIYLRVFFAFSLLRKLLITGISEFISVHSCVLKPIPRMVGCPLMKRRMSMRVLLLYSHTEITCLYDENGSIRSSSHNVEFSISSFISVHSELEFITEIEFVRSLPLSIEGQCFIGNGMTIMVIDNTVNTVEMHVAILRECAVTFALISRRSIIRNVS